MSKKEKWLLVALGIVLFAIACIVTMQEKEQQEGLRLQRPEQGSEQKSFLFQLDGQEQWYEIPIYAREKGEKEKEEIFSQVVQYIDQSICGENNSLSNITDNLVLLQKVEEYNAVIHWDSTREDILDEKGIVYRDMIQNVTEVELRAKITIGTEKKEVRYIVTILPYENDSIEAQLAEARDKILEEERMTRSEQIFIIPTEVGKVKIVEEENSENNKWVFLFIPFVIVSVIAGKKKEAEKEKKKYDRQLLAVYPNLVTKLTMYIGAGMTIRTAWEQLAKEYEKEKIQTHLGKAICQITADLHLGKSEEEAYERFGEQIGLRPYKRLAAILAGQSSRGGSGIKEALLREVQEAWEIHKEEVKCLGNETETKLIFPMLGMMIIVFSIVVIPAFFALSL